ncbi:MAG: N-formylglutamate amidohydrolase [Proteobacteria bacterium]|nr:N-formylglutamate amidohydrolase [Pseudomonadota bacterium]
MSLMPADAHRPIDVYNPSGRATVLLVCDHASNFIPEPLAGLGLGPEQLSDHVAWDVGAWGLARELADVLDAPLVGAAASRLLIDANRDPDAPDLIPLMAEGVPIPGNRQLDEAERAARIRDYHQPFHRAIEAILRDRPALSAVVSVHSFTPVLFGKARPWHVGILHDDDCRLADLLIEQLERQTPLCVGRNQPYAPDDGVYYTLDRHGRGRAKAMIEVRNDQLRDSAGQRRWAGLLGDALHGALARI